MSPRVGLAVNPTSGQGRGAKAGDQAARHLLAAGIEVTVLTGVDADDLSRRIAAALGRIDALVVVGGDGMVNLGVNATAGTGTPLGIVPAGTGNDIGRALGLPVADWPGAADLVRRALATGVTRRVDAARCTGAGTDRWFAGVLGAGFDALVNERANGWRWPRGRMRYNLAIARELPTFRPREYLIDLDGERHSSRAMLVAIGNGPSYGGGMRVLPDARMDDGLLDVMVLEPVSRLEFLRIFPRVYSGTHVSHPRVLLHRAREVWVQAAGIVGYADGERFGPLPLTSRVVPGALRLLAPTMTSTVER